MAGGRPTKYKKEYAKQAEKLTNQGFTDLMLADFFEVDVATIWRWKGKYPEFCSALKLGKDRADDLVEKALYERAMGYSAPEDDIRTVNGELVVTPTIKHYPPDTTAAIFWLKNRRPGQYREKPDPQDTEAQPLNITFEVKEAKAEVKKTNAKP